MAESVPTYMLNRCLLVDLMFSCVLGLMRLICKESVWLMHEDDGVALGVIPLHHGAPLKPM